MKNINLTLLLVALITVTGYTQHLIVGDTIHSNYHNIPDTTLPFVVKDVSKFDIDIDNDQIDDIRFTKAHASSPSFGQITYKAVSLNTVQFVGIVDSNHSEIDTLSKNTEISENLNWNNSSLLYTNFNSHIPPPWGPESYEYGICVGDILFIGFRKIHETDTIYGWFHLDMRDFTILSYATDQNSISIEEINTNNRLLAYPNPVETNLSFTASEQIETIDIYNVAGTKINSYHIHSKHSNIDVADIPKGVYMFRFIGRKGKALGVKKIILK